MKRTFTFLLVLVMLMGMVPAIQVDAATVHTGSCGENLTWTVNGNTITISGTGPMYDYSEANPAPWKRLYENPTIIIEEGVTSIGDYAFCDLPWSTSVYFPRGIAEIGEKAFSGTHYLKLYFYGKAPQIAANAFDGNEDMSAYYLFGWEETHLQNYGATEIKWGKGSVKNTLDTKLIYELNDPIAKEDFVIHYFFSDLNSRLYMYAEPMDLTVGEYDNSTPGSKSVTVTADGLTFEHQYFVSDGNYLDDVTVEAPSVRIYGESISGTELEPVVKLGDIVLTNTTHYTISYVNTKDVGVDGKIIVTGKGLFAGFSKTSPLATLKQDISTRKVWCDPVYFTGDAVFPEFSIYLTRPSGERLSTDEYTAYFTNNVNQGTASALLIGQGNYCGHIVHDFTIKSGYNDYKYITGAYNGQYDGRLDFEKYGYNEFIVPAGSFSVYIDTEYFGNHIATHLLYRIENGESILVETRQTGIGSGGHTTGFGYNFQSVYEEGIPEALYMLQSTWVDEEYRVYTAVTMLYVQGKQPEATAMRIDSTLNGTYRHGYFGAYGLNGALGDVTWSSSDDSVASIKDGVLTMYKTGTVTITASSGSISTSTKIEVVAEDIGDACIFSYDPETGKPIVIYDGFLLEEGVDYTFSATTQEELTQVTVTGCGVFEGQLTQDFDADGQRIEEPAEPEEPEVTPSTTYLPGSKPLTKDDKVIIYLPAYNLAVSDKSISYVSGFRQGTPIAIVDGNVYGCSLYEVWTVDYVGVDGEYRLMDRDKKDLHSRKWYLCPLDNGTYALRASSYVSPNHYLTWSETLCAFTMTTEDPRENPLSQFQLHVLEKGAPDEKMSAPVLRVDDMRIRWEPIEGASRYEIYRSTSLNGTYEKIKQISSTSYLDPDPKMGKTYYYKVMATYYADPSKNSDFSNVVSITFRCEAPYIFAENNAKGKPVISWNSVYGAKKYTVYRATSENGKYSKLGTTTKTTYTDTKAKAGTTYFYKVIANAASSKYSSSYSNIVSCGVICGTPTVAVTVDTTTGKPSLSWKKVDGATQYAIYRKLPTDTEFVLLAKQTAVSYKDTTAPIDTKCEYYVQALGKTAELNGNPSKVVTATSGIAKPTVTGSLNDLGQPKLTWGAVEGAVKYEIYRSTKSGKGYVLIKAVEGLSYEDTTATIGKTYYYKVKAIGAVSKSADSSYVKLAGKCATPELFIETDDSGRPYLKWYKVDGARKYTVYRATSQNGKYKKIGTTTKIEYIDTKAAPGSVYYYKIVANASSSKYSSTYSNIVSCAVYCATPTVKVTNNSAGAPVISWNKVSGAVKYKVMYMDATDYLGSASGPYADFGECHTAVYTTKTSFTIPNTEAGRFYMVVVVAVAKNESYSSEGSEAVFADAVPATPKLSGKVGTNNKPVISWKAAEGAVTYEIYRSTSKSKGYELLDETEDLSYEDLTAVKGKTYYYKVVAVRYNLRSAESTPVKVKSK